MLIVFGMFASATDSVTMDEILITLTGWQYIQLTQMPTVCYLAIIVLTDDDKMT